MDDRLTASMKTSKATGAMLGAAFGDALGWPNERPARTIPSSQPNGNPQELRRWIRRSGGRFSPHEEIVERGEYSDDTQLMLCLGRSLQKGKRWWEYLTKVELPIWSVYERGGGGATKRAVQSWLAGGAPWDAGQKPQRVRRYYEAGGNGVAMRILPHILRSGESEFPEIAEDIFLDGIATHGHPRALAGALAYGYALWHAFRKRSSLAYGELLDELIENRDQWSRLPSGAPPGWCEQADSHLQDYMKHWQMVTAEMLDDLTICRQEISDGGLCLNGDVLERIRCYDNKVSGAGTVAAAASVYLASFYAPDPLGGVVKAAYSIGSDTDTIASMTGALMGCIHGSDWLASMRANLQDSTCISNAASRLASEHVDESASLPVISKSSLKNWVDGVMASQASDEVMLPDHRRASIGNRRCPSEGNGKFTVQSRLLSIEDGQSIYLNKISRQTRAETASISMFAGSEPRPDRPMVLQCGPKISVSSMDRALRFYRDCLGLTVKKQGREQVAFSEGIVLVSESYADDLMQGAQPQAIVYFSVSDIKKCHQTVGESNFGFVSGLGRWKKSETLFFRAHDPDGNLVEVFSASVPQSS